MCGGGCVIDYRESILLNQHPRELINARKTSRKYSNERSKDVTQVQ